MFQACLQRGFLIAGLAISALFLTADRDIAQAAASGADCSTSRTQSEMTACLGDDMKSADALLNKNYQTLMKQLGAKDKTNLRDAQRAWIVYRDKECAFRTAPYQDGSVAPSLIAACVTELTSQRILDLRVQLNCEEGDLSCVPHKQADADKAVKPVQPAAAQKPATQKMNGNLDKGTCTQAVGAAKAKVLVDRCLEMSGSSHPPCNAENSCRLMMDEIKNGCELSGAAAPQYCKEYK